MRLVRPLVQLSQTKTRPFGDVSAAPGVAGGVRRRRLGADAAPARDLHWTQTLAASPRPERGRRRRSEHRRRRFRCPSLFRSTCPSASCPTCPSCPPAPARLPSCPSCPSGACLPVELRVFGFAHGLTRGLLGPPPFAPVFRVGRRNRRRHQTGPVERQPGILRFDRPPHFVGKRLAADFDLRRRAKPEQHTRTRRLAASLRCWARRARNVRIPACRAKTSDKARCCYLRFCALADLLELVRLRGLARSGGFRAGLAFATFLTRLRGLAARRLCARLGLFATRGAAGRSTRSRRVRTGAVSRLRWTSVNRTWSPRL